MSSQAEVFGDLMVAVWESTEQAGAHSGISFDDARTTVQALWPNIEITARQGDYGKDDESYFLVRWPDGSQAAVGVGMVEVFDEGQTEAATVTA